MSVWSIDATDINAAFTTNPVEPLISFDLAPSPMMASIVGKVLEISHGHLGLCIQMILPTW